jgi:hypothetical protein
MPDRSTPDPELEPAEALRAELEAELEAERGDFDVDGELAASGTDDLDGDAVAAMDHDAGQPELTIGLSPRQILGGFALLAAIVVWLLRRRKN